MPTEQQTKFQHSVHIVSSFTSNTFQGPNVRDIGSSSTQPMPNRSGRRRLPTYITLP
jgi:hypothetical protein